MSVLKIYKSKLTPERNALVDSITTYLDNLGPVVSDTEFQYQKLSLDMTIKINTNQEKVGKSIGNYCSITQDSKTYYFFILGAKWIAKECVELKLSMDTINTFRSDFSFNKKTTVTRQHKDRFERYRQNQYRIIAKYRAHSGDWPTTGNVIQLTFSAHPGMVCDATVVSLKDAGNNKLSLTFTITNGDVPENLTYSEIITATTAWGFISFNVSKRTIDSLERLYRKIDVRSEGANPVLYHNTEEDVKLKDEIIDDDWYLIYISHSTGDNQPVDCYLTKTNNMSVKVLSSDFDISPSQFTSGYYYYFPQGVSCYTNTGNYYDDYYQDGSGYYRLIIYINNGTFTLYRAKYWSGELVTNSERVLESSVTSIKMNTNLYTLTFYKNDSIADNVRPDTQAPYNAVNTVISGAGYTTTSINSIHDLERTDSRLIKVIKLPYCPTSYAFDSNNVLSFNNDLWKVATLQQTRPGGTSVNLIYLKLQRTNDIFKQELSVEENPYEVMDMTDLEPTITDLRNVNNESKMFHSDYYLPKFCYDSFNLGIALEKLNLNDNDIDDFKFNFVPTTTINSKFLFELPQYKSKCATEDYPNILVASRNNDITLFNDAYVNYIKTGYNYDVKNKERQTTVGWLGAGVSIAAGIAGLAAGAATGGLSAAVGISLISSAANQIINNVNSTIQLESSIEQKLAQYKNQATTVSGSDDVDLMSYYTGNRAQLKYYKISPVLWQDFNDLFYYCGYADNTQEVPSLTSRTWFNYIQCDPVFNEELTTPYQEYLDDIKARYKIGVTVYHNNSNLYDWAQEKENWEVGLL